MVEATMVVINSIMHKLTSEFRPVRLHVRDESHSHEGHAGYRPGGQTHFRVSITSEAFRGVGKVERHRMVYAALADEIEAGVHALAIEANIPEATDAEVPMSA
jgi:BolA protein